MASRSRRRPRPKVRQGGRTVVTPEPRASSRSEWFWLVGVVVGAATLFTSTVRGHVALGDSPESVAGVSSIGILHAPGYPAYVLAARVFSWLAPVGDLAFRVNLFSAVCTTVAVAGVFAIARRFGISPPASAVAAFTLASGTSTLFYAGYAKHYGFSGMLLVLATLLVVRWGQDGGTANLVVGGALVGVMAGASWQLALLSLPGLVVLLAIARRKVVPRTIALAIAAGTALAAALYGFVLVRAGQDPAVNWGDAHSLPRLARLVMLEDFGLGDRVGSGSVGGGGGGGPSLPERIVRYVQVYRFELSAFALIMAGLGLFAAFRKAGSRSPAAYLVTAIAVNTVAAAVVVAPGRIRSVVAALILGGFLIGALVPIAIAVGFGIDWLTDTARRVVPPARHAVFRPAMALAIGLALVVPSLIAHVDQVERRHGRFAEQYASNMFASVPEGGALVVWSAERTFPLVERQVVHGERRDVTVIAGDGLAFDTYRSQLERRLDIDLPPVVKDSYTDASSAVRALQADRRVVLDLHAAVELHEHLGYEVRGLVADPVPGAPGARITADADEIEAALDSYDLEGIYTDRFRRSWPNRLITGSYLRLHLELARLYVAQERWDDVERNLLAAEKIDPEDESVQQNLEALAQSRPD